MLTSQRYDRMVTIARNTEVPEHEDLVFRHFCFVFRGDKILTMGWNSNKTHPMASTRANAIHAEFDAATKFVRMYDQLRIYEDALKGLDVLVIRISSNPSKDLRISRPCPQCERQLIKLGARKVYYSGSDGRYYEMKM